MEPNSTQDPSLYTYPERVLVSSIYYVIILINLVGNSLVIMAVVFSHKLRTRTNVFVVNLSCADLMAGLALPWSSVGMINPGGWPLETKVPCVIAGAMLYISSGASLFNLASIALNRAIIIKRPMTTYRRVYTKRNLIIMAALNWIIPITVMTIPPLAGVGGFGYDRQHHTCSDLDTLPNAKLFELIQTITSYPITFIIIITSYIVIYIHVRRHFKTQLDHVEAAGMDTSEANRTKRERLQSQQLEITKNLFVSFCFFLLCISPYSISLFFKNNERWLLFGGVIFLSNSCINPFIYAAKHPQFKVVLRKMVRCRLAEIPEPSSVLKAILAQRVKRLASKSGSQSACSSSSSPRKNQSKNTNDSSV